MLRLHRFLVPLFPRTLQLLDGGSRGSPGRGSGGQGWYALAMDTTPDPDEIHEMREDLHRLIDRLSAEALVALWRLVWLWVSERQNQGS